MNSKITLLKHAVGLYTFVFLVWGVYRYLFRLPEEIEEIILKPLVWLGPTFWLVAKEKGNLASVGWSGKNLSKSLYLGIGLGVLFAFLGFGTHLLKYGEVAFIKLAFLATPNLFISALVISLLTAISEETAFRGYIFNRLQQVLGSEWQANLVSSFGWALVHLPITIFVFHYNLSQMIVFLGLSFIFGMGSALVFGRTKTITASVLLHVFWSWPIVLFR